MRTLHHIHHSMLALTLVMSLLLGLFTLGTVAAADTEDYTDREDIGYNEAVDVLGAIGVLEGYPDGSFAPNRVLNRAEACTIITRLMHIDDAQLPQTKSGFSDMDGYGWAEPYVAFCRQMGIVEGTNLEQNTFSPGMDLTGAAFGKMLLVCLGYQASRETMTGPTWQINVAKLLGITGLQNGIEDFQYTAALSRQEAAQMAFQTLTADMIEYMNAATVTTGEGTVIDVSATRRYADGSTKTGYDGPAYADGIMQFCEQYFPNLSLDRTPIRDAFGRNISHRWSIRDEEICRSYDSPVAAYIDKVRPGVVRSDLMNYTDGTVTVYRTGETDDTTITTVGAVKNMLSDESAYGRLIEVYADQKALSEVVMITYTVATVTDKHQKDGVDTYVFTKNDGTAFTAVDSPLAAEDNLELFGEIDIGDVVTYVRTAQGTFVYPTTRLQGAQSAYNASQSTITVDGELYTVGTGVQGVDFADFASNSAGQTTYYLDQFGFIVKRERAQEADTCAYVVKALSRTTRSLDAITPQVSLRAVLSDGTVSEYTLYLYRTTSEDKSYTSYYADRDRSVYLGDIYATGDDTQLLSVTDLTGKVFSCSVSGDTIALASDVHAITGTETIDRGSTSKTLSGDTVLFAADTTCVYYNESNHSALVQTGTLRESLSGGQYHIVTTPVNGYAAARIVFADLAIHSHVDDYVYVLSSDVSTELVDGNTRYVHVVAERSGDMSTRYTTVRDLPAGVYTWDEDGQLTSAALGEPDGVCDAATYTRIGSQLVSGESAFNLSDDTAIVYVGPDGADMRSERTFRAVLVLDANNTHYIETVFVIGPAAT